MFEPAVPTMEQTQTYALDRMVTGITNSIKWMAVGQTKGVWFPETTNDFSYGQYIQADLGTKSDGCAMDTTNQLECEGDYLHSSFPRCYSGCGA